MSGTGGRLTIRAAAQRTVRGAFSECTVLTVAHRLHTIIDYDRILVLEAGQALEFGSPQELMQVDSHTSKPWNLDSSPEAYTLTCILVLEAGQALEFGGPQELMQVSWARLHGVTAVV